MTTAAPLMHLGPMPASARMRTLDERFVQAPLRTIFGIAADVERWPERLSHYRRVQFRERTGECGVVEMSADRPFGPLNWPTWWVSLIQIRDEGNVPSIRFRHIDGITTRMEVEWLFAPASGGTRVSVLHLWNGPAWPLVGALAARAIIGPVFVHGIASRTLAGLARFAEHSQTSA